MFREIIEILLWLLLIVSMGGLIWRLFFVRYPKKDEYPEKKKGNPQEITNWDVYYLLREEIRFLSKELRGEMRETRGEMRWLITFQTGVLIALLGLILSRI